MKQRFLKTERHTQIHSGTRFNFQAKTEPWNERDLALGSLPATLAGPTGSPSQQLLA